MSTVRKGSAFELRVREYHEAQGWVAASRRHIGGPADEVFIHPRHGIRLVEAKNEPKTPYKHFGREKRQELLEMAQSLERGLTVRVEPLLAVPGRNGSIRLIPSDDWPTTPRRSNGKAA